LSQEYQEQGFYFITEAHVLVMFHQRAGKEYETDRANNENVQGRKGLLFTIDVYPQQAEDAKIDKELWNGGERKGYSSLAFAVGKLGKIEGIDHVVVFYFSRLFFCKRVAGGRCKKYDGGLKCVLQIKVRVLFQIGVAGLHVQLRDTHVVHMIQIHDSVYIVLGW